MLARGGTSAHASPPQGAPQGGLPRGGPPQGGLWSVLKHSCSDFNVQGAFYVCIHIYMCVYTYIYIYICSPSANPGWPPQETSSRGSGLPWAIFAPSHIQM